jgi:DUF971 family protein
MLMSATQTGLPQPAAIKVHKTSGSTMEILWKDGHQSTYTFAYLRNACPCAMCNEERTQSGREPDAPAASAPLAPGALPMFKPALRPDEVAMVGNYAIRFDWNDGHVHGIFSWQYLRDWCPCAECHAHRHSSDGLKYAIEHHPPRD